MQGTYRRKVGKRSVMPAIPYSAGERFKTFIVSNLRENFIRTTKMYRLFEKPLIFLQRRIPPMEIVLSAPPAKTLMLPTLHTRSYHSRQKVIDDLLCLLFTLESFCVSHVLVPFLQMLCHRFSSYVSVLLLHIIFYGLSRILSLPFCIVFWFNIIYFSYTQSTCKKKTVS